MNKIVTIDIHSKGEYPSCAFSNFEEHEFYLDGVKCMRMEDSSILLVKTICAKPS